MTPDVTSDLAKYVSNLQKIWNLNMVILHGSQARGYATPASDFDLMIIAKECRESFLTRIGIALEQNQSTLPIEPIVYTAAEFEKMFTEFAVGPLEAIYFGQPLYGQKWMDRYYERLTALLQQGLSRQDSAWHVPVSMR